MDLLFVYGTLRSQFDNRYARLLREGSEFAGRATAPGTLYRISHDPGLHYPGYRPEPHGVVHGELYRLRDPETMLRLLDEYEGEEYERVRTGNAWIYQYRTQPPESARIASGDFCAA